MPDHNFTTENSMTRDGQDVVIYATNVGPDNRIDGRVGNRLISWYKGGHYLSSGEEHPLDLVPKRAVVYCNQRGDGTWLAPYDTSDAAKNSANNSLLVCARIAVKFVEAEGQ